MKSSPPHFGGYGFSRFFSPSLQSLGAKKSTQTFFVQSFSKPLRVMDVRAKNRGRPHQKVRVSAAPVMGRNFLTQGHPGVRVRNVRGKSGPKSLCLCCFFFPESLHLQQSQGKAPDSHAAAISALRSKPVASGWVTPPKRPKVQIALPLWTKKIHYPEGQRHTN